MTVQEQMSEEGFEGVLSEMLQTYPDPIFTDGEECRAADVQSVRTFDEAMILTNNKGLVVRLADGSEFQITIVKSR